MSADICSLKQGQVRAALACHLVIDKDGTLKSWRFTRAKICVAANIAYEHAQAAIDGTGGEVDPQLVEKALKPLWECWRALLAARNKRQPLELDIPERRVVLDEKGRILSVAPRERLDAHRLVEDYMIAANVAAAKALEAKKAPVMYRVHEAPGREKLIALKDYLATFGVEFALGQVIRPATFNQIIERIGDADFRPEVMEQLLRTQMQARYGPETLGHFGLALGSYAHFTSPIRRYADLLVHRALVATYKLGEGGLPAGEGDTFDRDRRADLDARAARDGGRARHHRPLCRGLPRRPGRAIGRMPDHRGPAVRLLRHGRILGGDGLVLARDPRQRIFPLRRESALAGRGRHAAKPIASASGCS